MKAENTVKYLRLALAALLVAAGTGWLAQAGSVNAASSNPNDAAYWEARAGHDAKCYKHDPATNGGSHGYLTDDGKAVTLNPFDPSWPGDHWELLVVKSGSNDIGHGPGNAVYVHPQAGIPYFGPANGSGDIGAVSHWIVCKGTAPDKPADKVEYTDWQDQVWVCGDTSVTQTRTKTVTTYVLENGEWVPGEPVVTTETQTRPLTGDEIQSCKPADKVQQSPWVDGTWKCGDTSVTQTRTVTVTSYVLVDGKWLPGTPTVDQQTQVRQLSEGEQFDCVEPRIDATAFSPVCQADIPYIQYAIEVSGTPNTTATITLYDKQGNQVARYENQPFSGKLIYPGASAGPADWPGWKYENGTWNLDPSDAHLREGLTVKVEVDATATAEVAYPPAGAPCNGPTIVESQAPTTTAAPGLQDPTPATTVTPVTQLPSTGNNGTGLIAGLGLLLLLAGGAMVALVRRPRHA